jgi:hypothetical protein
MSSSSASHAWPLRRGMKLVNNCLKSAFISMHAWVAGGCLACLTMGKPLAGRRSVQELGEYPSATQVFRGTPADSNPVPLGLSTDAGELLREVTSLVPETEAPGSCSTGSLLSNTLSGAETKGGPLKDPQRTKWAAGEAAAWAHCLWMRPCMGGWFRCLPAALHTYMLLSSCLCLNRRLWPAHGTTPTAQHSRGCGCRQLEPAGERR